MSTRSARTACCRASTRSGSRCSMPTPSMPTKRTAARKRRGCWIDRMTAKILVLPGDGIGPEVVAEAVKVLEALRGHGLEFRVELGLIGGAAIDAHGTPLPPDTLAEAESADAILMGAVGGPKWDGVARELRPESGLLKIRQALGLFANLRPALCFDELADASTLKPGVLAGLDLLIVRELTGGIYYGK